MKKLLISVTAAIVLAVTGVFVGTSTPPAQACQYVFTHYEVRWRYSVLIGGYEAYWRPVYSWSCWIS